MKKIALLLFYLLSDYNADELELARAIAGEQPDLVSHDSALAEHVGQVVLNRLDAGWCPTIPLCVEAGFWGAVQIDIPPNWALEAARRLLERGEITNDFYVFSRADCHKLGLEFEHANYWQCSEHFCLAFYGPETVW